ESRHVSRTHQSRVGLQRGRNSGTRENPPRELAHTGPHPAADIVSEAGLAVLGEKNICAYDVPNMRDVAHRLHVTDRELAGSTRAEVQRTAHQRREEESVALPRPAVVERTSRDHAQAVLSPRLQPRYLLRGLRGRVHAQRTLLGMLAEREFVQVVPPVLFRTPHEEYHRVELTGGAACSEQGQEPCRRRDVHVVGDTWIGFSARYVGHSREME